MENATLERTTLDYYKQNRDVQYWNIQYKDGRVDKRRLSLSRMGSELIQMMRRKKRYGTLLPWGEISSVTPIIPKSKSYTEEEKIAKHFTRLQKVFSQATLWEEMRDKVLSLELPSKETLENYRKEKISELQETIKEEKNKWLEYKITEYQEMDLFTLYIYFLAHKTDVNYDMAYTIKTKTVQIKYHPEFNERMKKAIEEKGEYHHAWRVNYDNSVQIKDGKGWYSEEYRGCGNGYYYLLLNHTTAIFCEKD